VLSEEQKAYFSAWRKANPDKVRAAKRKYYQSEKGKIQKRKEENAYVASGGRAKAEARRALKPLSESRKAAKAKWAKENKSYFTAQRSLRRSLERNLSELDYLVLYEAVDLAKRRKELTGYDWHVDHIIPVSKGGLTTADNLQVVPAKWNRSKSNKHTQRFWV
jgi:hypoxanthine phosphoribosyltransferase